MKVTELQAFLEQLVKEGKGEYIVFDEGYMNEIIEGENLTVDDHKKRVYL